MRDSVRRAQQACPVEVAISILGGSWKLTIVKYLQDGTLRTSELQRLMPLAPERTLTRQLRELEEDGIITRTVHPEVPPRVEYSLTELGGSLHNIVRLMNEWGRAYPASL